MINNKSINPQYHLITILSQIFLLYIITQPCSSQQSIDLVQDKNLLNGWNVSSYSSISSSSCTNVGLLFGGYGGFNSGTLIMKTILLSPHYKVTIKGRFQGFEYYRWNDSYFYIYLDNKYYSSSYDDYHYYSSCSRYYFDHIFDEQTIYHTSNSLTIAIYSNYNYWGIYSLDLYVHLCDQGCKTCENGYCQQYLRYQELNLNPLSNVDGWIQNSIYQTTKYQLIDYPQNGLEVLQMNTDQWFRKKFNFYQNHQYQISFKIIFRNYISFRVTININSVQVFQQYSSAWVINRSACNLLYQIEEFKTQKFYASGLINIEIITQSNTIYYSSCSQYMGIRDFEIVFKQLECLDSNLQPFDGCFNYQYSCVEGCQYCVKGICYRCKTGWLLQQITKKCIPICGDKIITYFEECDDGNQVPYDGCHNCKYSCPLQCEICQFGKCILWKSAYSQIQVQNVHLQQEIKLINSYQEQCDYMYKQLQCYTKFNYYSSLFQLCDSKYLTSDQKLESQKTQLVCGDKIVSCDEECDDGNQIQYDGCYECKFQCIENCQICILGVCQQCQQIYTLFNNKCMNFQMQFKKVTSQQVIEGYYDQIQSFQEQGFQQHINLNKEYYQYKQYNEAQCNLNDYSIFGYQYNLCQIWMIENCILYDFQTCIECASGYILDFFKQQCIAKCGDYVKQYEEQCDENPNIQFSGCYQCQNSCQLQCLVCKNQKCLECQQGWFLNDDVCVSKCGDGVIAIGSTEQCDDGQANYEIGCLNCKIICSSNCLRCASQNICLECEEYYTLTNEHYCMPICGDKHLVEGIEECDDGNNIEYDGCYNCQYSCRKGCVECENGICKSMCSEYGYYYNETLEKCQSICGDGIVANNEECDDKNDKEFDGCFECRSSCDEHCVKCFAGECQKCQDGYPLEGKICVDICGNGKKSPQEKCDDDNNVNGDGCSSICEKEKGWFCFDTISPNKCLKQTQISLTYLNQTSNLQYVKFDFTKLIKFGQNNTLSKSLDYKLLEIPSDKYSINISVITELSNNLSNSSCVFIIDYLTNIKQATVFSVSLASLDIIDEDEISVDIGTTAQISLKPSEAISEKQISTAESFQALGTILIYSLAAASAIIFLSGNPSDCLEILDALQYQSYLRYINVKYPKNIVIYFESSDSVTINPVLVNFKLIEFFDFTIGQNYIEPIGKFLDYDINADLLSSVYGQISQIGLTLFLFFVILFYKRFYFKYCFSSKHFYLVRYYKLKILELLIFGIYKINKLFFSIGALISLKGIKQLFLANSWDLTFKVFLFLASYQQFNLREKISYIICGIFFFSVVLLVSTHFRRFGQKLVLEQVRINQHETIILIKRILFLFVLINLQSNSVFQCIFSMLLSLFYIGLIYIIKFTESKLEQYIIYMTEIPILLFTFSSLAYCQDFIHFSTDEHKILLAFAQIGVLILGLAAPLIKHLYHLIQKIKQYITQKCKKQEAPKIMNFYDMFTYDIPK